MTMKRLPKFASRFAHLVASSARPPAVQNSQAAPVPRNATAAAPRARTPEPASHFAHLRHAAFVVPTTAPPEAPAPERLPPVGSAAFILRADQMRRGEIAIPLRAGAAPIATDAEAGSAAFIIAVNEKRLGAAPDLPEPGSVAAMICAADRKRRGVA